MVIDIINFFGNVLLFTAVVFFGCVGLYLAAFIVARGFKHGWNAP